MEQKPLKRNENIIPLSKDHHTTLLFCWKLTQGIRLKSDPEVMKKYVNYFWKDHMEPHFREEEEILFSPLVDEMVQKAIAEHHQIKDMVDRVLKTKDEAVYNELAALSEIVDAHVRYEERQLFPHLEQALNEEQLSKIGDALKMKSHLPDIFKEEFWKKSPGVN
jgi:iron-sulfur cluster repair protein YtfE (RIC family)